MPIPQRLLDVLRCTICNNTEFYNEENASSLKCKKCEKKYSIVDRIPYMMDGGPEKQDWNVWDLDKIKMMGDSYYKRAKGELPEKESSKSYARFLKNNDLYSKGDELLDLGCATGHFLRSFRSRLDENILYTGLDTHIDYLHWGNEIFGINNSCNFIQGDACDMPLSDNSFDSVIVNLFHFFPNIKNALKEAMRVGRKTVIWRTPIAQYNYIVKLIYNNSFDELNVITPEREDFDYSLYMLYSLEYLEGLVKNIGGRILLSQKDDDFQPFDNTILEEFKHVPSTKTVQGLQINGALVLDWHYIVIDCSYYKK